MICELCNCEYVDSYSTCPNCCGEGFDPLHQILLAAHRRLNRFAQDAEGAPLEHDLGKEIGRICYELTPESDEEIRQIYALHPGLIDLDLATMHPDGTQDLTADLGIVRVNIEETISDYLYEIVEGSRATLH